MVHTRRSRLGFTLLELLVSISIIALMLGLATVSYTTAQRNGRDARRRNDMQAVQKGLEQYFAENQSYPANCTQSALVAEHLPSGYPTDPRNLAPYVYSGYNTCTTTSYCICALLEREGSGNANSSDCSDMTPGDYFCVRSLQ